MSEQFDTNMQYDSRTYGHGREVDRMEDRIAKLERDNQRLREALRGLDAAHGCRRQFAGQAKCLQCQRAESALRGGGE